MIAAAQPGYGQSTAAAETGTVPLPPHSEGFAATTIARSLAEPLMRKPIAAILLASSQALLSATASGQVPAHATVLNPSGAVFSSRAVLQIEDRVHVFGDSLDGVLRHARSQDGGRTWGLIEQPIATGTDPNYAPFPLEVAALDATTVLITRESSTPLGVLRSPDSGQSWQAIPVSTAATSVFTLRRAKLYVEAQLVLVVWTQGNEVFVSRSTDGGLTWPMMDVRLDNGIPASVPGPFYELRPFVFGDASALTVLWSAKSVLNGTGVTLRQQSFDGGVTWQAAPQQVAAEPFFAIEGRDATLLASWLGPYMSTDQGATWTQLTLGTTGFVDVAVAGATLCVVGPSATSSNELLCASFDNGATWQTTNATGTPFTYPRALAQNDVAYAWFPQDKVHYNRGSGWRTLAGEVHHVFAPGPRRNVRLTRIDLADQSLRAYVGTGYTLLGQPTAGTGGLMPVLHSSGTSALGDVFSLELHQLLPASLGALGVSQPAATTTPPVGIPFAGGLLWPGAPLVIVAFATGAGSHSEAVAVPSDPALIGTGVVAQAIVLDAGATGNLALTNGVEVWLR